MEEKIAHKLLLKEYCEQIFLQRIATTQQAMDDAQAAANSHSHRWHSNSCRKM